MEGRNGSKFPGYDIQTKSRIKIENGKNTLAWAVFLVYKS